MEPAKYKLFKQSITVAGVWDYDKSYERLVIVTKKIEDGIVDVYISRLTVPEKTKLTAINKDKEPYWHRIGGFDQATVVAFRDKLDEIDRNIGTKEDPNTLWGEIAKLTSKISGIEESDYISYKGEINSPFSRQDLARNSNGLYIFNNAKASSSGFRQAEDFEHYNQRGIETGEVIDKGSYIIPADCRDLFKWHSLRKDFDWTIETGDVLIKTKDGWDIIASEDVKESGGEGGGSYPIIEITYSDGNWILPDDKQFTKGTETVHVNGVSYFHETGGYEYVSSGEEDPNAAGITFNKDLNIDETDEVIISAKLIN